MKTDWSGIITFDDILDVIEEENTEDMERMGGVIDNTDKDYLDTPVLMHVRLDCHGTSAHGILRVYRGHDC